MASYPVTYAQNREDIILAGFFDPGEIGMYVDVGAFDPDQDSVTRLFYLNGWHGINVEPQPNRFERFVRERVRDTNVNVGISDKNGKRTLRSYKNEGLSTFSKDVQIAYAAQVATEELREFSDLSIQVMTLAALLDENNVMSIQFMNIDVEGHEYEVLAGNDWDRHRPEVICIEANHIYRDWRPLLRKQGYSLTFFDGLNEYYTDDRSHRAAKFDYVQQVVFREPIMHYKLLPEVEQRDRVIDTLKEKMARDELELEATREQIVLLQGLLDDVTPLRRHIIKSVKARLRRIDHWIIARLSYSNQFQPTQMPISDLTNERLLQAAQEVDQQSFESYNTMPRHHPILPVYKEVHDGMGRLARKAAKKVFS